MYRFIVVSEYPGVGRDLQGRLTFGESVLDALIKNCVVRLDCSRAAALRYLFDSHWRAVVTRVFDDGSCECFDTWSLVALLQDSQQLTDQVAAALSYEAWQRMTAANLGEPFPKPLQDRVIQLE